MEPFVANEQENLFVTPRKLEIRKCGREVGSILIEGIELEIEDQQKPYFLILKDGNGYVASLSQGFILFMNLRNMQHTKMHIKMSLSFESISFDELRDAFIINKDYLLYVSQGKLENNEVIIEMNAMESKEVMILYAHKNVYDAYLLKFSQRNSFESMDYTPFLARDYYLMAEYLHESMILVTDSSFYNTFYMNLKNKIIGMIKKKAEGYDLCRLKGHFDSIEKLLMVPYLLSIGGEKIARDILIKYWHVKSYIYLYALKQYVEHTRDLKFYDAMSKNKLHLATPSNIIEKIARIIYLNKMNDHKETDNILKELLLNEDGERYLNKILLLLPFTSNLLHNVLVSYLKKYDHYHDLIYGLEVGEYKALNLKKEEDVLYSYLYVVKRVADIAINNVAYELDISIPEKSATSKAKIRCDELQSLSLDLSYDRVKKRFSVNYEVLEHPYTLKIHLPDEFDIAINGKQLGKLRELVYEVG